MITLLVSMLLSFVATYFVTPYFIRFLQAAGIVGIDIHKKGKPKIAEMGGPAVLVGFLTGVFFYIAVKIFLYHGLAEVVGMLASISTALIISIIGIFDDLGALAKRINFKRMGISRIYKVVLPLPAAIPLVAILAGYSTISVPFIGNVNLGILYPLLIVPIVVTGMSNAFDMIAGMNGLEASLGIAYLGGLGIFAFILGEEPIAALALSAAFALFAFLRYNWYPAKIMAGDSLVYFTGAVAASVVILGNIERFAVIAFIPWFIELGLKLRVRLNAENFGKLQKNGTLKSPYKKIYSLTSLFMRIGRFSEKQIVACIVLLELFFVAMSFLFSFGYI